MNSYSQQLQEQGKRKGSEVCLPCFNTGCIRDALGFKVVFGSAGEQSSHKNAVLTALVVTQPG